MVYILKTQFYNITNSKKNSKPKPRVFGLAHVQKYTNRNSKICLAVLSIKRIFCVLTIFQQSRCIFLLLFLEYSKGEKERRKRLEQEAEAAAKGQDINPLIKFDLHASDARFITD